MSPPSKRSRRHEDDDRHHEKKRKKGSSKKSSRAEENDDDDDDEYEGTIVPITEKDYFIKAPQFRIWLKQKKKYMDEMSSEENHKLFAKFVRRWNQGRLTASIYLAAANDNSVRGSRHKWGFAKNVDKRELETVKAAVSRENFAPSSMAAPAPAPALAVTEAKVYGPVMPSRGSAASTSTTTTDSAPERPGVTPASKIQFGPVRPPRIVRTDDSKSKSRGGVSERERVRMQEEAQERQRREVKAERKAQRRLEKQRMDELAPPPSTAHEARQEKRHMRAYERTQRDQSPEMKDATLMGSSNDYQNALRHQEKTDERRTQRHRQKMEVVNQRHQELRAKEASTMAALRLAAEKYNT